MFLSVKVFVNGREVPSDTLSSFTVQNPKISQLVRQVYLREEERLRPSAAGRTE